ncbi:hypothetical protein [Bacillus sp. FJAT-29814]|uniref:hypothetical protein n=1 Tax=Bacillus sp. FJAT-29814 TaxID=1729688 RepID=UPI0008342A68|nr:hypothetical protein [Bacillus sp. FJAT-29814]
MIGEMFDDEIEDLFEGITMYGICSTGNPNLVDEILMINDLTHEFVIYNINSLMEDLQEAGAKMAWVDHLNKKIDKLYDEYL